MASSSAAPAVDAASATTVALCPPLVITRAECDRIVETLGRALHTLAID